MLILAKHVQGTEDALHPELTKRSANVIMDIQEVNVRYHAMTYVLVPIHMVALLLWMV